MDTIGMIEAGMLSDVQRMDVISQNLANVSTVGYKQQVASVHGFTDFLSGSVNNSGAILSSATGPTVQTATDYTAGALKYSGNPMDVAIEGSGYFVVSTPAGEAFTREGNLQLSADGQLTTASGLPIMGSNGDIQLSGASPKIDQQGNVYEGNQVVDQLRIVDVANPDSLTRTGDGLFIPSDTTQYADSTSDRVQQGFTEAANVNSMNEMVQMIETMRHFEASQKLAHGLDDMLDKAISQLGQV